MRNILKKKEGITLIALVITIIVLLLLAGISISMLSGQDGILSKAGEAKQSSSESEEYDKMALAVQEALINGYGKIDLDENSDEDNSLKKALDKAFKNTIKKPDYKEGEITLSNGEKYNVKTSGSIEKVQPITFSKTVENLAIGDEVTASNGETFYVIGGDDTVGEMPTNPQDIILLSKYNLEKVDNEIILKQDTTQASNECAFADECYWANVPGIAYPYSGGNYPDLNNESEDNGYPLKGATSIITIAKEYGESLNAKGRLMTVEEVKNLGVEGEDTSKCPFFINDQGFWLGSAYAGWATWIVDGPLNQLTYWDSVDVYHSYGVRPVIEVPISLIKK